VRAGVRPHRPWVYAKCLVGRAVAADSPVVYGYRHAAEPERGDCGWSLWSSNADFDIATNEEGLDIVEVGSLHERHCVVWNHLALPPGWGFVLGADGYKDVFYDP